MARKLRVQYPGAIYHVMNRGDRREAIFVDDQDRVLFLETLDEACQKTDWQVHAWCLMSNHLYLGSEEFRKELLAQVSEQAGSKHAGEDIRQSAQAKAEGIVQEELTRLGWAEPDLQGHRKGDGRKVSIAARLRRETAMTLAWIAERLHTAAPGHVACLLYRNDPEAGGSENKVF